MRSILPVFVILHVALASPLKHRHYPQHFVTRNFEIQASPPSVPYPPAYNTTLPPQNARANGSNSNVTSRWLPSTEKVRGVNLGSQFIIEPWMAWDEWQSMGCGQSNDEWKCVELLGQDQADAAFAKHWSTWITQGDIADIADLGLNVVRIPVGFWMREDLVEDSEFYPKGALKYLDQLVGYAADAGLYVIIDLHGGPGSQIPNQQFTGHGVDKPGFFTYENYERALKFLEWMALRIHSNQNYRSVGVLQVINEPAHAGDYPQEAADMIESYYPAAYSRIRTAERSLGVQKHQQLKIQYMGNAWGSGDPTSALPSNSTNLLFDDHRYYKWDNRVEQSRSGYISAACTDNRGGSDVLIGEWSLSINDQSESRPEFAIDSDAGDNADAIAWYKSFWAAQVTTFERSGGWVFWSYKCNWINGKDEWRWCYQSAVRAGVIPDDASAAISLSPCS